MPVSLQRPCKHSLKNGSSTCSRTELTVPPPGTLRTLPTSRGRKVVRHRGRSTRQGTLKATKAVLQTIDFDTTVSKRLRQDRGTARITKRRQRVAAERERRNQRRVKDNKGRLRRPKQRRSGTKGDSIV